MEESKLAQIETNMDHKMALARDAIQMVVESGMYADAVREIHHRSDMLRARICELIASGEWPEDFTLTLDECMTVFAVQGHYSFKEIMARDLREAMSGGAE